MSEALRRHINGEQGTALRAIAPIELRADQPADGPVEFSGYAIRWDEPALIQDWWDEYLEVFERGSWAETIAERGPQGNGQIKLCYKHDGAVMRFGAGPTAGKVLELAEDEIGVRFTATTIDTSTGRDLAAELRAGTVDRMSFAFEALVEREDKTEKPRTVYVQKARVYEISPVNWPANAGSTIDSVRGELAGSHLLEQLRATRDSVNEGRPLSDEAVKALREAGELVTEITENLEATERAGAGSEGETAGAVEVARARFALSRRHCG